MTINKNILKLSMVASFFLPLNSHDTDQNIEPTPQQIELTITYALNDSQKNFPSHEIHKNVEEKFDELSTAEKALVANIIKQNHETDEQTKTITLENAAQLLQTNIDEALRVLTPREIEFLTTMISEIIDSAITEIQILKNHEISVEDGTTILQTCINNLVIGSKFTLDGTTYTITAPKKIKNK